MITDKIVKCKGDNIFLEGEKGGLAYGPRKDFKDTDDGKNIIDGYFVAFDGALNDNNNVVLPMNGKYIVAI